MCWENFRLVVSRTENHFLKPMQPVSVFRLCSLGVYGMCRMNAGHRLLQG